MWPNGLAVTSKINSVRFFLFNTNTIEAFHCKLTDDTAEIHLACICGNGVWKDYGTLQSI